MGHKELLEEIVAIRPDIFAAVVIADGKIVEELNNDPSTRPPEQDVERALLQSHLLIGMVTTNEGFAGRTNFVLISHERMNALLVPLPEKKVLIVAFAMLDGVEGLGSKVLELARRR